MTFIAMLPRWVKITFVVALLWGMVSGSGYMLGVSHERAAQAQRELGAYKDTRERIDNAGDDALSTGDVDGVLRGLSD